MRIPSKPSRQKRRRQEQQQQPGQPPGAQQAQQPGQQAQQGPAAGEADSDVLNPVQCASCGTEVALRDGEGVYHFINVVASNA